MIKAMFILLAVATSLLTSTLYIYIYIFICFSEGIIGETLSKFSIWSLYITFVLAVARFIRLQCSDLRMRIPYENLPSCDRYVLMIYFR